MKKGKLFCFEGADGVGKSTLLQKVGEKLAQAGADVLQCSSPGKIPGTLGEMVYRFHHKPESFGVSASDSFCLQVLHVAAHIDALKSTILPALSAGKIVLLDRFWWSTLAYGLEGDLPHEGLKRLVNVEKFFWQKRQPDIVFVIQRQEYPFRLEMEISQWQNLQSQYTEIARDNESAHRVIKIMNENPIEIVCDKICKYINQTA